MAGRIFAIQNDGTLHPMAEAPYADEDLFQRLLSDYPDLLAGEQINEASPRRWMLVSREVGVPLDAEGGDQFSVDHLFLDQDGVPTLVEVKRSSDHRIRWEVVGQMLDYAAHAVAHWRAETIRGRFEAQCDGQGRDPAEQVAQLIQATPDDDEAIEAYWNQVDTNLRAGHIRLIFAADEIGGQLRRVIEFLNRFMDPVEVLGVEIRHYRGQGIRALVPRLVGRLVQCVKVLRYAQDDGCGARGPARTAKHGRVSAGPWRATGAGTHSVPPVRHLAQSQPAEAGLAEVAPSLSSRRGAPRRGATGRATV